MPDTVVTGDIGPDTDWTQALRGIDAVVHLAARVHQMDDPADPSLVIEAYRRINVEGTRRLAESAAAAGVRRMVFVSTIKAVTENSGDTPVTEATPPAPETPYGISKLEGERALTEVGERTGLETVILRPPLVYGPGVGANFLRLLALCRNAPPLPAGRHPQPAQPDLRRESGGRHTHAASSTRQPPAAASSSMTARRFPRRS